MPSFRYTAVDAEGRRETDELEAATEAEAAAYLESVGFKVEKLERVDAGLEGQLSDADLAEFSHQVAKLSQAGLPLEGGLHALGDELAAGPLRRVLRRVSGRLEAGQSLAQAIEFEGRRFPPHLRGLVLAGARTGRLAVVLEQFSYYQQAGIELSRRLALSLAYPLLLLVMTSLLFIFISIYIIDKFTAIYKDFGIALPAATRLVLAMARVVNDWGFWCLILGIVMLNLIWISGVTLGGSAWRRSLTSTLPLLGPLWRWTALAQFTHLLGLLLESEVSLPTALRLTGEGCGDADIAALCQNLRYRVEAGRSIADGLAGISRDLDSLARMLRWAGPQRSLPEALHLAGDLFEARARAQARFVGVACTIIAIVLVLWGVAVVVGSLMTPMIQLISKLSG